MSYSNDQHGSIIHDEDETIIYREKSISYGSLWEYENEHASVVSNEYFMPVDGCSGSTVGSNESPSGSVSSGRSTASPWLWRDVADVPADRTIGWNCFSHNIWDIITMKILGFESNPCRESSTSNSQDPRRGKEQKNSSYADLRLSMLSNFSTSYNILSVSLALHIMSNIYDLDKSDRTQCSSALLAGMILGQLAGGALGDAIGRHKAMTFVMFLQVFAACGSAFSCGLVFHGTLWFGEYAERLTIFKVLTGTILIFAVTRTCTVLLVKLDILKTNVLLGQPIIAWRFILGLGCGGVYPLAATLTAESSVAQEDRAKLVALTFSMQGVGYLAVPLLAWILITILGEESDISWRLLLGIGALPGIILTFQRIQGRQQMMHLASMDEEAPLNAKDEIATGAASGDNPAAAQVPDPSPSIWDAIRDEKDLFRKLVGTAGCWFIFDILYYGNTLFQPVVLEAVFGGSETLQKTARDASIIALLALPGYFISVALVGHQSPRFIQIQGFFAMSILYAIIGASFFSLSSHRPLLLLLYGGTFFFSDYGPNTTVRIEADFVYPFNWFCT